LHNIIRTLSRKGICSRKEALALVKAGRVSINGLTVLDPGKMIPQNAQIFIDNKPIGVKKKRYFILNKPTGYVTTRKDEMGRRTIYDLIKEDAGWVFPVGRLDRDTEGLLILTNDTVFGDFLTDPRNRIPRTYEALIEGSLSQSDISRMLKGVNIGRGEISKPVNMRIIENVSIHSLQVPRRSRRGHLNVPYNANNASTSESETLVEITLTEGKNREVRRLCLAMGKPVKGLKRTRFGPFRLGSLKTGSYLEIPAAKIDHILKLLIYDKSPQLDKKR